MVEMKQQYQKYNTFFKCSTLTSFFLLCFATKLFSYYLMATSHAEFFTSPYENQPRFLAYSPDIPALNPTLLPFIYCCSIRFFAKFTEKTGCFPNA